MDIPGNGGQITLDDNTVIGIEIMLGFISTEDGDFSELTVEQRTIRLNVIPAYGVAEVGLLQILVLMQIQLEL